MFTDPTTNAARRAFNCGQCQGCVNGPTPENREQISPEGVTYLLPSCFAGHVYPASMQAVCRNVRRWDDEQTSYGDDRNPPGGMTD